jgi:hypothetical protein
MARFASALIEFSNRTKIVTSVGRTPAQAVRTPIRQADHQSSFI